MLQLESSHTILPAQHHLWGKQPPTLAPNPHMQCPDFLPGPTESIGQVCTHTHTEVQNRGVGGGQGDLRGSGQG